MRKQTLGDLGATCMEVARFLPGLGCSAGEKNQLCSRDGSTSVVLSVSKQFFFGPPTDKSHLQPPIIRFLGAVR